MTEHVSWTLEAGLDPAHRDELVALMTRMVAQVHAEEPGCLTYDWYLSPDQTICHIVERYADEAAALAHIAAFETTFAASLFKLLKPQRLVVYGAPPASVLSALAPLRPMVMGPLTA